MPRLLRITLFVITVALQLMALVPVTILAVFLTYLTSNYRFGKAALRSLVAEDICICVWLGGPFDLTMSSMCGLYNHKTWWGTVGTYVLDKIQYNHVKLAIKDDSERAKQAEQELVIGQ